MYYIIKPKSVFMLISLEHEIDHTCTCEKDFFYAISCLSNLFPARDSKAYHTRAG